MTAFDQGDAPPASSLEWPAVASMGLAVALVIALTQPGAPRPPPGFPTFAALGLTIIGCALEVAATTQRMLAARAGWLRMAAAAASFVAVLVAGGWLIGRAPGREVLFGWLIGPPIIGIFAVAAAGRRGSWPAVAFLAVVGILVVFLGLRWIGA
jgi:hypothetical protein